MVCRRSGIELQNIIERAVILATDGLLHAEHLQLELPSRKNKTRINRKRLPILSVFLSYTEIDKGGVFIGSE
ncbi:MAG: hypothetical protein ACR2N3_16085 [Pyrinomonadaceae bacterium]